MVDYGQDFTCTSDLETVLGVTTGRRVVAEAVFRRLITPRGRLIGDANYGFDLTAYINGELDTGGLGWLRSAVIAECEKDERVLSATCEMTWLDDVLTATIGLSLAAETFTLVLAVSAVSVELLTVT